MRKIVSAALILLVTTFCSCTADTSGFVRELTESAWDAQLEGGGTAKLSFFKSEASLELENSESKLTIGGEYVADDEAFVIFMPENSVNYKFEYSVSGKTLTLKYDGGEILMTRRED